MNCLHIFLTVALIAGVVSTSSSQYLDYLKQTNQIDVLQRQLANLCPGKAKQLNDVVGQFRQCADLIDENSETACSALRNHYLNCSKPVISFLEMCLPEESKTLPDLIFRSVHSTLSYLCSSDGEHIFELANNCFFKTNYRSVRCQRRARAKLQKYKKKTPSKDEICEAIFSFKPCLKNHLQDNCGNVITQESFMRMFEAVTAPCKTPTH